MKKRFLSAVLSCVLIFTMTVSTAFAEVPEISENPVDTVEAVDEVTEDLVQEVPQGTIEEASEEDLQDQAIEETEQEITEETTETTDPSAMTIYSVTYNTNGGTGGPEDFDAEAGYEMTFPDEVPYRYGYNFRGWRTNSTIAGYYYQPGEKFTVNKNIEFIAQWVEADDYTDTGESEDTYWTTHFSVGERYYFSGTYFDERAWRIWTTGSADTFITVYDSNKLAVASNDDGGEGRNADLKTILPADKDYTVEIRLYSSTASSDVTIHYGKGYLIKLYADGAKSYPDKYMTFGSEEFELPLCDYEETTTQYMYANGGTFASWLDSDDDVMVSTLTHYTFNWNTQPDGSGTFYDGVNSEKISRTNVTLYPYFEENAYYLPYYTTVSGIDEPFISREGYTFDGMYTDPVNGTKVTDETMIGTATYRPSIVRIYAHWTANETPLKITKQPTSVTASAGSTAKFSVTATGDGLTYQWQYSTNSGSSWTNSSAASAKTATLSTSVQSSFNGRLYRCIVKDSHGKSVTSSSAKLTVSGSTTLAITTQPKDVTAAAGGTATFTVVATGTGLTYQWQYSSNNGSTWTNSSAASAKTKSYTTSVQNAYNGRLYRCIVKDSSGKSVTSNTAKLTVSGALSIITQPQDVTAPTGSTATFTVVATGTGLTYQWQYSTNGGSTWINSSAASAKTATLSTTVQSTFNGRKYRCIVKDSNGKSVNSTAATLTVGTPAAVQITKNPANVTAIVGATAKFSVTATGTGLTYQWQYSTNNGSTWINSSAASAKTATLSTTVQSSFNGRLYRCIVKDSSNNSKTSTSAKLTVK